jgi:hypothetical protein
MKIVESGLGSLDTDRDRQQADDLMAAGWRFELPATHDPQVYQWYWRRPPRRKGSRGMKFWSTSMAWNALQREKAQCAKTLTPQS